MAMSAHHILFYPQSSRPFLYFFLVVHFFFATDGYASNNSNPACPVFDGCGNGVNISYPFWISRQNTSHYCGYPEFKVTCGEDTPTLEGNIAFNSINYTTKMISFDLQDLSCPRAKNSSSTSKFPSLDCPNDDFNLTFFFNCLRMISGLEFHQIHCRENHNGDNYSYVFVEDVCHSPHQQELHDSCRDVVVLPVRKELVSIIGNISSMIERFFQEGFQLRWDDANRKECLGCESTGGRCGFQNSSGLDSPKFACFCQDGSDPSQKKRIKKKRKIIAALSALSGFLVLLLVGFYLWCRYRKNNKRTSSLDNLIRSSSSKRLSMEKDTESHSKNLLTHIFSYKELEEATECFASSNELGDGGFGTVYKGNWLHYLAKSRCSNQYHMLMFLVASGKLRDGRIVAVKRLYENNYKRVEQFLNEVEILNLLRHQNLVTLYGCTSRHSRELLLVYEYVANGTVADHLHGSRANEDALTWPIRMDIAIETASALKYLHAVEPQVIHRDVKTNNILLDENYRVKVADFGLSRLFPPHASHVSTVPQGTPGYVDPEYHQCYKLTDKSDVYSFGVVLVELISSKPAVDITRHRHEINLSNMAINKIQHCLLHELVDLTLGFDTDPKVRCMIESVAEVAFRCLQAEKEMRPSMEEVLELLQGAADRELKEEESPADTDKKMRDDTCLLKDPVPYSPDSVAVEWVSRSTTPNASG